MRVRLLSKHDSCNKKGTVTCLTHAILACSPQEVVTLEAESKQADLVISASLATNAAFARERMFP